MSGVHPRKSRRLGAFPKSYVFRFALCFLAIFPSACSPAYVLRAGYEEAKILWRRQPIEAMLQRGDLDRATRSKLELVLAVRTFARDTLHLRVGGSYASFARVDADQVVHVVSAAYRLRLEPYTWWFPVVGRVPYKGFFSHAAAEEEAASLEAQGYDTYVRPSVAFSTLGWFDDPLLSNLLRYDRATLANVIIHELLHNTSYLAGHAQFAESFANFVGHRGAMLFFATRADADAARHAQMAWRDALQFSHFLAAVTARLRQAYAAGATLDDRQRLFADAQDDFRHRSWETAMFDEFATRSLNNAVVLDYLLYADRLWLFDDAYHAHDDDLAETIRSVLTVVESTDGDPFEAIQGLQAAGAPAGQGSMVCSRRIP